MGFNLDFGKMFADAGKGIQDLVSKTTDDISKALDQTGDGKFDMQDVQVVADRISEAYNDAARKAELNRLRPLFQDDITSSEFVLPKLIRVMQIDQAHKNSAVCKDSIGFRTSCPEMQVVNIYTEHISQFGLTFSPALEEDIYYVDPSDRDHYIAMDEYFSYLKVERINELQRIAQSLGAKHFKVTYKEMKKNLTTSSAKVAENAKYGRIGSESVHGQLSKSQTDLQSIRVQAEMSFPGHAPVEPKLQYLRNESSIQNLIKMRMDPDSPLQHQHFNMELIHSSGIKEKDAVKIDAALRVMKVGGNFTVSSEVQDEARKYLEYEIDF